MAARVKDSARKVGSKSRDFVVGFRSFIRDYGVLPLAIGVVIGSAVNDLVKTLVDGLVSPFIGLIAPSAKLQSLQIIFHGSTFKIGAVVNALLTFITIALVVYISAKVILRKDDLLKK